MPNGRAPDEGTPDGGRRLLDAWTAELSAALGLDLAADTADLLDLARAAAHNVARPAAPLTTFLVGYAAGLRGGGAAAVAELTEVARALAEQRG
jgi:hypothetical protein